MATQPDLLPKPNSRVRICLGLDSPGGERFHPSSRAGALHLRYCSLPPAALSGTSPSILLFTFVTQSLPFTFVTHLPSHTQHAILVAYYVAQSNYQALLNGSLTSEPELFGARIETPHIRHCFDYLRRGIMCASDTNLEVVSYDNHTTNGWGQDKKCQDYGEVFEFAERWANSSDTGIVT